MKKTYSDKEWDEYLKKRDTLIGASMRFREALIECLRAMGIEKFLIYLTKKIDKLLTKILRRTK